LLVLDRPDDQPRPTRFEACVGADLAPRVCTLTTLALESGKVSPDQMFGAAADLSSTTAGPHDAHMKDTGSSESERPVRGMVWALVALATASLAYSIRFMILYPRPELPFFFRYELASLGLGILTGAAAQLFFKGSSARRWLRVVSYVALVAAIVGLFQMPH
jgi:hypothetical protein